MNIIVKKKEEKTEILNNLKTVKNVVNNIIDDLFNKIPDDSISVFAIKYIDSMRAVVDSIQDGMNMIEYSLEHGNDVLLSSENALYLIGVEEYCDLLESKAKLASSAIEKFKTDLEDNPPPKKRGFWKTIIGLD